MMNVKTPLFTILCAYALLVCPVVSAQLKPDIEEKPQAPNLLKGSAVEDFQIELLELAWQAATSYPINPHIKNRARAEEQVVMGALGINQPQLAWGFSNKVVNWRKGMCYAEIAHYLIENEQSHKADYFLHEALSHGKDNQQGWREARVRSRVAAAKVLLGQELLAKDLVESEDASGVGEHIFAKAEIAGEAEFDALLAALDRMAGSKRYEMMLAANKGYAQLFKQNYKHEDRRALLLDRARNTSETLPGMNRFEMVMGFAEAAHENGDAKTTGVLLDEAQKVFNSFNWRVDSYVAMLSDVAIYRVKAGQPDKAKALLEDCMAFADKHLETVPNYERAAVIRAAAEGYAALGDTDRAHALYARTVELGAVNPNIRPRVSDITSTCVSMALHAVEPKATLLATIETIVGGLVKQ